jgi:hypothetical protein
VVSKERVVKTYPLHEVKIGRKPNKTEQNEEKFLLEPSKKILLPVSGS